MTVAHPVNLSALLTFDHSTAQNKILHQHVLFLILNFSYVVQEKHIYVIIHKYLDPISNIFHRKKSLWTYIYTNVCLPQSTKCEIITGKMDRQMKG